MLEVWCFGELFSFCSGREGAAEELAVGMGWEGMLVEPVKTHAQEDKLKASIELS